MMNYIDMDDSRADLAVNFVTRTTNAWLKQGLPLDVIAKAMIGAGTVALHSVYGAEATRSALDEVRFTIDDDVPQTLS